jgi:DNA-binding NarL/FixJ family response regulator
MWACCQAVPVRETPDLAHETLTPEVPTSMALLTTLPRRSQTAFPAMPGFGRGPRPVTHALVVHHADVVRAGIAALLTNGSVCEVAGTGSVFEAFRLAAAGHPQLILFDYTAGEGAEACRLLAGIWPHPRLIALVSRAAGVNPATCLAAGVDAVVAIDNVTGESFLTVVQRTINGATPVIAGFPAGSMAHLPDAVDQGPTAGLTRREREMLFLIGEGLSNKEIAESLVLSVKTVEAHRANLSRKLNVRTRSGLMRLALAGSGSALAGSLA